MTDKELKKLRRLELLELLLEESRENERLRKEIERLKSEESIITASVRISEAADKLESVLGVKASEGAYEGTDRKEATVSYREKTESSIKAGAVDADIYKRIMVFFCRNPRSVIFLPEDIRSDVEKRIREIMSMKK